MLLAQIAILRRTGTDPTDNIPQAGREQSGIAAGALTLQPIDEIGAKLESFAQIGEIISGPVTTFLPRLEQAPGITIAGLQREGERNTLGSEAPVLRPVVIDGGAHQHERIRQTANVGDLKWQFIATKGWRAFLGADKGAASL